MAGQSGASVSGAYHPTPLHHERLSAEEALARSRAFLRSMQGRRSVRQFSPDPIPFELIENAILTAGTAPSGAHQQPWTFVVISDPDVKQRIRAAAEKEEWEGYHGRMTQEWMEALRPLGTDWIKEHITTAPYVIVVFERTHDLAPDGRGGERVVKHYYVRESVGIAVGLLLASFHQAGLVALTHTPSPMGFLRKVLDRPSNERPFVVIPVGLPAPGCMVPDLQRKSSAEIMARI